MDLGYENQNIEQKEVQLDENGNPVSSEEKENLNDGEKQVDENGNPIEHLNDKKDDEKDDKDKGKDNEESTIELNPGETIEIGDDKYTVAENGDLIDKDGKVFKEAKDVKEFLKDYQTDEDDDDKDKGKNENKNELNIKNIQEALGYQIVDEEDKEIEYENNIEGIKTYVNDVIDQKTEEIQEATLNSIFEKYPFAKDMINYYIANGNSLEGWNAETDRFDITIDDNNEKQQEDIIRTAWKERKMAGDVESYISYLKSSGTLLSTAKSELEALQKADKDKKEELEKEAQAAYQREQEEMNKFWKGVEDTIKTRKLGQYKIPEQIKITRGGKSYMVTPTDFYKYISVPDKDGQTAYVKDCNAVSSEQQLTDSLLRAYIMFTGGDYSSLVDMAIKEEEVKKLRLKAKEGKQVTRRLTPKGNGNKSDKTPDLGY